MSDLSPFDHRPDAELSEWLREALSAPDDPAFVARVMARVPSQITRESSWDILGEWSRPGLAAAAVLVMLAGFGLGGYFTGAPVDDAGSTGIAASRVFDPDTLLESRDVPQVDVNLVMVYEYERQP
jgi:hypothetical protein